MEEKEIGTITHYFSKISVALIQLADSLRPGDNIHVKGHTTDFAQQVESMQIEHVVVPDGKPGEVVGIKVAQKVHPNDKVFKVTG